MTKNEYLVQLKQALARRGIKDYADILSEYDQHFAFKFADGYTEEEVAAKLGAPDAIAAQFEKGKTPRKMGKRVLLGISLTFLALFEVYFYLIFYAWVVALFAGGIATAAIGVCLIFLINVGGLLPYMPALGGTILGVAALGLSAVFIVGSLNCGLYARQMIRASIRWHKNTMSGSALPALPTNPQLSPKRKRGLRTAMLISVAIFGIAFVLAFATLALQANAMGFWHVWHWFQ